MPGVFELFTYSARAALVLAQDVARVRGHVEVGTRQLLLGLLHGEEHAAFVAVRGLGIDPAGLRLQGESAVGPGAPRGSLPFTAAAKQVLVATAREKERLRHDRIGTGHLLLALIAAGHDGAGQGGAARMLHAAGADLEAARGQVRRAWARDVMETPERDGEGGADGRHPGLGRALMCHRREDLPPELPAELDRAFCHAGLVMVADDEPAAATDVAQCDVVIAVIGPYWLPATTERGERRIEQPADPVRTTLEAALALGKPVLPVLVGDPVVRGDQVPAGLAALTRQAAIRVPADALGEHVAALMRLYAPQR